MNINMPTSLAGGRYQLGQLVGRGGMAKCMWRPTRVWGVTVAVKIMRADSPLTASSLSVSAVKPIPSRR